MSTTHSLFAYSLGQRAAAWVQQAYLALSIPATLMASTREAHCLTRRLWVLETILVAVFAFAHTMGVVAYLWMNLSFSVCSSTTNSLDALLTWVFASIAPRIVPLPSIFCPKC